MSRVFWTETAEAERGKAIEFIAHTNLEAALEQADEVDRQSQRLLRFPHLGRPGRKRHTRELSIARFRFVVTYRIMGEHIQILHFRHTSQKS